MGTKFTYHAKIRTINGVIETIYGSVEFESKKTLEYVSNAIMKFELPEHLETLEFKITKKA